MPTVVADAISYVESLESVDGPHLPFEFGSACRGDATVAGGMGVHTNQPQPADRICRDVESGRVGVGRICRVAIAT